LYRSLTLLGVLFVVAKAAPMSEEPSKPGTLFIVSELRDGKWHDILVTRDEDKARELLETLGDKGKLEEFAARSPKRW